MKRIRVSVFLFSTPPKLFQFQRAFATLRDVGIVQVGECHPFGLLYERPEDVMRRTTDPLGVRVILDDMGLPSLK